MGCCSFAEHFNAPCTVHSSLGLPTHLSSSNPRTLGVEETLKLLVTSLATPWDRLQLKNVQTEQELLENFAQLHASAYVYSGEPHGQLYRIILRALMANRLLVVGFPENSPPHLYLGAVQCLRQV